MVQMGYCCRINRDECQFDWRAPTAYSGEGPQVLWELPNGQDGTPLCTPGQDATGKPGEVPTWTDISDGATVDLQTLSLIADPDDEDIGTTLQTTGHIDAFNVTSITAYLAIYNWSVNFKGDYRGFENPAHVFSGPDDEFRVPTASATIDGVDVTGGTVAIDYAVSIPRQDLSAGFVAVNIPFASPQTIPRSTTVAVKMQTQFSRPGADNIGKFFIQILDWPTIEWAVSSDLYNPVRNVIEVDFGQTGFSPNGDQVYAFDLDNNPDFADSFDSVTNTACGFLARQALNNKTWQFEVNKSAWIAPFSIHTDQRAVGFSIDDVLYVPTADGTVHASFDYGQWDGSGTRTFKKTATTSNPNPSSSYPATITLTRV